MMLSWLMPYFASARRPTPGDVRLSGIVFQQHGCGIHALSGGDLPGGEAPLRFRADHQITELAVHDWDLARATGQQAGLDPAVAEHALRWSRQMLRPEFRGLDKAFGLEVPVPDDAPAYDRLAGWFGRDPGWRPGGS